MEEVDPQCAAPPHARPVQVHPHRHHAEDGAVAVAERVDGVDALKKAIKNSVLYANRLSTMCGKCGKAMVHRRKRKRRRRRMEGGNAPFMVDFKKGFQLLTEKDMWKTPSKAEVKAANNKRAYRASGTRDSYKWLVKKGHAKKVGCCLM